MPPLLLFQTTAPMLLVGFAALAFQAKAFTEDVTSPLNPKAYRSPTEAAFLGALAAWLFVGTLVGEFMALRSLFTGQPSEAAGRWVLFGLSVQLYCLGSPVLLSYVGSLNEAPDPWVRQTRLATGLLALASLGLVAVLFTPYRHLPKAQSQLSGPVL